MDITTLYKTIAPLGRPRDREAIPPAKSLQDRKRHNKKRERKQASDQDVVVTLSERSQAAAKKGR